MGPLRKPGDGGQTDETIDSEVQQVMGILNHLRANKRQQLVSEGGGYGQYVAGELIQPPSATGPANGSTAAPMAPANGTIPQAGGPA